jgi:tetratricopeptide (TPR) repeat protein
MKYKISLLFFLLLFVAYVLLSFLNSERVPFDVGFGRLETTVTNYVAAAFVLGIIFSIIASFFTDARRGLAKWRSERKERRRNEAYELFEKAKLYEMKGEPEKAEEYINRVIRSVPDMEEPYLLLADMHAARGAPGKAIEALDLGEKCLGKKEAILMKKAKVHRAQKDLDAVERDLLEAVKIRGSSFEALRTLRDLYISRKAWAQALETEEKVRKQIKTPEEDQRFLGLRYESAKERYLKDDPRLYEQVLKDLREIISDNKRFIPAYTLSAEVYKSTGKLNDAGRVYGRGFAKTGHIVFLRQLEDLYINRGEPGVILKIYRRLLEVAPRNQLLMFFYARLCLKLEMIDEAIDVLTTLLADEKEFRGLHRAMAEAYIHRGKFEDAVKEFSRAFPISQVYLPFYCVNCQAVKEEWTDFCETCSNWNTVNIRQDGLFFQEAENLRMVYEENWEAT